MKIYLTGYSGFIGNSIYQTLSTKYKIVKVNLRKVNFQNQKETNDLLNIFNDSNIVINCAANLKPQKKNDFFLNEEFPNILSNHLQTKNKNSKLIHLSTINVLIKERKDLYTISKRKGEESLKNSNCSIIRLPLIYKEKNGEILNEGNFYNFFKYLDFKLPFYPMIYPGHTYQALEISKFIKFLENNFLKDKNFIKCFNISGEKKRTLWNFFKIIAEQKNKKTLKLNISKWIPSIFIKLLMKKNNFLQQFVKIDNSNFKETKTVIK
jgi:dTDP-4-dehydrorhamnose reductase